MLPIVLETSDVEYLLKAAKVQPYKLHIDLEEEKVEDESGFSVNFTIHPYWKKMLVNGWDEIQITLQYADSIQEYENNINTFELVK